MSSAEEARGLGLKPPPSMLSNVGKPNVMSEGVRLSPEPLSQTGYGGSVLCRPQRWFPTPRGSFNLERSSVSETPERSTWDVQRAALLSFLERGCLGEREGQDEGDGLGRGRRGSWRAGPTAGQKPGGEAGGAGRLRNPDTLASWGRGGKERPEAFGRVRSPGALDGPRGRQETARGERPVPGKGGGPPGVHAFKKKTTSGSGRF